MASYVFGQPALQSFAEFAVGPNIARPIQQENSPLHVAAKRRMRPIAHARHVAVLHGIDVAILNVPGVIGIVADHVLPEPPLPDAALVARLTDVAAPFLVWQRFREGALDERGFNSNP